MSAAGRFREQRLQPWWLLLLAVTMTVSLGIAYGTAVGLPFGLATGALTSALAVAWWWQGRSPIAVDDRQLRVGRMRLDAADIGAVSSFAPAEFAVRISTGVRADEVHSLLHRQGGGVVVEVADETDPFRRWVIGSSHPAELAAAISAIARS